MYLIVPCYRIGIGILVIYEKFSTQIFMTFVNYGQMGVMSMTLIWFKKLAKLRKYVPIVEDISLYDDTLCNEVENIEEQ